MILDLGMSSLQLNDADRGFSFQLDGTLDMRYDRKDSSILTAAQILNNASKIELEELFKYYGDVK